MCWITTLKYRKGTLWRVTRNGATLTWWRPAPGAGRCRDGIKLLAGDVLEVTGRRRDWHPSFRLERGRDGQRPTAAPGEFSPSRFGLPAFGWLSSRMAGHADRQRSWRQKLGDRWWGLLESAAIVLYPFCRRRGSGRQGRTQRRITAGHADPTVTVDQGRRSRAA
jgi:hypothetical protein